MNLTKTFVENCKDKNCYNDWSYGWWIVSFGGKTDFKSGIPDPDYNSIQRPFFALTAKNLDCDSIGASGLLKAYHCE
jgi:hypothetical protein